MAGKIRKKIGQILIEDDLLEPSQLKEALAYQAEHGGLIGQILIEKKFVDEEHIVGALGKQFRIPYLPLKNYTANPDAALLLKPGFCRENLLVPFDCDAKRISIAIADPSDQEAIEKVKTMTQRNPQIFISRISEIRDAIFSLYQEKI